MGSWGVGMPAQSLLDAWVRQVNEAFPEAFGCYLVGSATRTTQWRDVDVRMIFSDDVHEAFFGPLTIPLYFNPRWNAIAVAFSHWGRQATGLPIDFQTQPQWYATEEHGGKVRYALGIVLTDWHEATDTLASRQTRKLLVCNPLEQQPVGENPPLDSST